MTIATVMVYVDSGQNSEQQQLQVARSIATKFEASVVGVSAFAVEPDFVAEGVVIEETTPEDLKRMKAALAQKEKWFQEIIGLSKDRVEWRWSIEYPSVFLANEARAADLVVITSKQKKIDPYHSIDPAGVVLRIGRPMVLVPEHVHELRADRIVVGWKDTREARLAVRDALPFLKKASHVMIIEICTSNEQDAARGRTRDVSKYLQRHGVKSETDVRVYTAESDSASSHSYGERRWCRLDRHRSLWP